MTDSRLAEIEAAMVGLDPVVLLCAAENNILRVRDVAWLIEQVRERDSLRAQRDGECERANRLAGYITWCRGKCMDEFLQASGAVSEAAAQPAPQTLNAIQEHFADVANGRDVSGSGESRE